MIARRSNKGGILVESIILIIGIGLFAKAFTAGTAAYEFIHLPHAQITDGHVVGKSNLGFTVMAEYTAPTRETISFSQNGLFFNSKMGDHVPVIFDPEKTGYAYVNKFHAIWFRTIMFSVLGIIVLGVGLRMRAIRSL